MFHNILLCTHGTDGAQRAEQFIFKQMAADPELKVTLLTVLDEDWRLMTGDDWLNSSKTQTTFLDHVEEEASSEIAEEWQRIKKQYPQAEQATFLQRTGGIAETITGVAQELGCDLIVIGPTKEKKGFLRGGNEKGLKATMKNTQLHPLLPCPLLVAP